MNLLKVAAETVTKSKLAVLLLPGIGTVEHLKMAHGLGVHTIRVATHCTEADVSEQHITMARRMEMDTVGFLMMAHMRNVDIDDWEAAIPAFVTFLTIPLTYSIAHGIAFGFVTYVIIKVFSGKSREVHPMMYVASVMLAIFLALPQ